MVNGSGLQAGIMVYDGIMVGKAWAISLLYIYDC